MLGIEKVASSILNRQVRVGTPINLKGMWPEYVGKPEMSAAVGSAMLVARTFYKRQCTKNNSHHPGSLEKVLRWIITKVEA
ncbi:hypothetical protein ANAPC1_01451 [Anaplasma phagocytophilum]|uniref:Uncharacterized protein n=1 Tax=Anaplasma phagocytophilum TaxID=948 RepID=A0AA45UU58_ANAPH|nr:hypothetical protein ANAPC1_01400 [Anaplasma phagocytophilum]SBO15073.1 hypothetical protein ANAPC1_01451 [Anaplasma phagocytophilum]SBO31599.1 hypothetical protein ANAPC3_00582 [Anaplasma phagocytophilum]SBO33409.1 hypothetical protein ANAPC2_01349 [Anaplasma phagocytophilum]SBO33467.1 hypothetical protein ANAPC4_01166 [Anaplasma phagocytophilum]